MTKFLPTVVLIIGALGGVFSTQIQHAVSVHPELFTSIATIVAAVLHWMPAPSSTPGA